MLLEYIVEELWCALVQERNWRELRDSQHVVVDYYMYI